ncbi:MAG: ribonuclease P protein subunit [Thermoplasmatales archaeon]|jgi:RNase P/RNase MRP subunit p29
MNPLFTDIIGENVKVVRSKDPTMLNRKGVVVEESKNMIYIIENDREIALPKKIIDLEIKGKIYDMSRLMIRPEDKIRKMRRKGKI